MVKPDPGITTMEILAAAVAAAVGVLVAKGVEFVVARATKAASTKRAKEDADEPDG